MSQYANLLQSTGGGSGSNASVGPTGSVAPTSATEIAYVSTGGILTAVSPSTPLPVTGTVTATNPSVSPVGAAPPADATYIGGLATTAAPTYITGDMEPFSLTLAGALRIDGSAVTQPVSGTVTALQGTSPWVISGTVTANAGTGTFAISAASLPLPTGASTSALQSAVQSAPGTPQTVALTVQGNASGVPIPISGTTSISGPVAVTQSTSPWIVLSNDTSMTGS